MRNRLAILLGALVAAGGMTAVWLTKSHAPSVRPSRCRGVDCTLPLFQLMPFGVPQQWLANGVAPQDRWGHPLVTTRGSVKYCSTGAAQDPAQLLVDPEQIGSANWSPNSATAILNAALGPDGLMNASALVALNGSASVSSIYAPSSAVNYSGSIHLRSDTPTTAQVVIHKASGGNACTLSASLTSAWQRFSCSGTGDAAGQIQLYLGNWTSGVRIYAADAKLEPAASSTPYPFTGQNNQAIRLLAANQPCVSPSGVSTEGNGTNLVVQPQALGTAPWGTQNGATATNNQAIAPDGTMTATRIANGGLSAGGVTQGLTLNASTTYTVSLDAMATATSSQVDFGVYCGGWPGNPTNRIISGPGSISGASLSHLTGLSTTTSTRASATWTTGPTTACSIYAYPDSANSTTAGNANLVTNVQVEPGGVATSRMPMGTRAQEIFQASQASAMTASSGCAKACFTPSWTGSPPSGINLVNRAEGTSLIYFNPSDNNLYSYNGSAVVGLNPNFTAGVKKCYLLQWTPTSRTLSNLTDGTSNSSATPFTGFTSGTLQFGSSTGPAGGDISDVRVDSLPWGCQ